MAFITLEDIYGSVECVAFPAIYEKIKGAIANDKVVTLKGRLDVQDDKEPSIIIDDMQEYNIEVVNKNTEDAPKPKKRQNTLWLNATMLSDDDFDDMVNMLSNYEGNTVCAIVRGSKRYKMSFGVNYCRGLVAELGAYITPNDIKYVE
jgi:DNA polymerase III alpha subunit